MYHEYFSIDKNITLRGENKKTTTIINPGLGFISFLIEITGSHVTVTDFTLLGHGRLTIGRTIFVKSDFCTIQDNMLLDLNPLTICFSGIWVDGANHTIIENNTIGEYPCGQVAIAVKLNNSSHNIIKNNTIGVYAVGFLLSNSDENIIVNNTVNARFWVGKSSYNTISTNNLFVISFSNSSNNEITHNNFQRYGLKLRKEMGEPQVSFNNSDNLFDYNYWGRPRLLPKVIFGYNGTERAIEVDWHPTIIPYKIM